MTPGRLLVLPSSLILLLYIRNLLAIVEDKVRAEKPFEGEEDEAWMCVRVLYIRIVPALYSISLVEN